jgi:8-oxo-dGTP pyrophosphatase MutT (NUDIX family)
VDPTIDPAAELVAVYDAAGAVTGVAPRGEVYARSLWHGVGGVLLRSGDGERVYVHRRTETKLVMPGLHDCWAGGVVAPGEDPATTAARELAEELGVSGVPLTALFTQPYDETVSNNRGAGLRSHMFAFEARWDGPVHHQPSEVADGRWMRLTELRERLADPTWGFVPDGRVLVERWFAEHGCPVPRSPQPWGSATAPGCRRRPGLRPGAPPPPR